MYSKARRTAKEFFIILAVCMSCSIAAVTLMILSSNKATRDAKAGTYTTRK